MLVPRGHNVDGPHLLRWPKVGNPHRPNATLLVGSTWDQHDGSTSGQRNGLMAVPRNSHVCKIKFVWFYFAIFISIIIYHMFYMYTSSSK